jgi:hypothetical protein
MAVILAPTPTNQREALYVKYKPKIQLNPDLNRTLVSYQADKETPFYRWFKYREGFTSRLVHYLLEKVRPVPGMLLDPFAGSGSALFAASELDWQTCGIELLPVGAHAIEARKTAARVDPSLFTSIVSQLPYSDFGVYYDQRYALQHIAITKGAFPPETERELIGYLSYCNRHIEELEARRLALYASFCVLEDISYTRKDGQYLRWDQRSGRSQGTRPFDKGRILTFNEAITAKLNQISQDLRGEDAHAANGQLRLFDIVDSVSKTRTPPQPVRTDEPQIIQGSCLEALPTVPDGSIDCILTSPPYANRYDYTRTYALELVYLGCSHQDVTGLRQAMLSCTVENKTKRESMKAMYEGLRRLSTFERIERVFERQHALQEVLSILDDLRDRGELNNANIASLVRNYFYEMCFVVYEMARVLAPGGHVIMVNDNVRYAGEEVPVDLILSSFAEEFGLVVDRIWTLARGKGNSSQQMGAHGRSELRKCVYVWRKP